jgi:hypothetical protein
MVKATLDDGQELYAVNDLFIGQCGHGSAHYEVILGASGSTKSKRKDAKAGQWDGKARYRMGRRDIGWEDEISDGKAGYRVGRRDIG